MLIVTSYVFSGVLSTARKVDRETNAQFSLEIKATDGRGKASYDSLPTLKAIP